MYVLLYLDTKRHNSNHLFFITWYPITIFEWRDIRLTNSWILTRKIMTSLSSVGILMLTCSVAWSPASFSLELCPIINWTGVYCGQATTEYMFVRVAKTQGSEPSMCNQCHQELIPWLLRVNINTLRVPVISTPRYFSAPPTTP